MPEKSVAVPEPFINVLRREHLLDEMPQEQFDQVVEQALGLIERRFENMRTMVTVAQTNINPFLMLAMAPAYNIFSPLEAAEYMQNAKLPHGDSTAFGKFVEDRIFPIFGVIPVDEKKTQATLYSAIDGAMTIEGESFLATWKSGPWTMNQSHANEMGGSFPSIHEVTGKRLILGIFYGRATQMNNKPALVRRNTGDYFHVLIGSELWEFITGVRNAHMTVLRAIREAQRRFAVAHGGKTFNEHMIEARLQLSANFRAAFGLSGGDEDMWEMLFKHSF
ncbi:PmeII family type II restriction endonuclease [Plantibacter elymi (nom. nud.)]|nr:PmeII family type II restriction endonuclease [Plantibacter sp. VKM Ac-1784]